MELPCAQEPHVLGDHDEGAGGRLGEAEPQHHLSRVEPAVVIHRNIGDVAEHRISAAEGHERGLGEEKCFQSQRDPTGSAQRMKKTANSLNMRRRGGYPAMGGAIPGS